MRITRTTLFIGSAIVLSSSFTRQIMDYVKRNIGSASFINLVWIIGIVFLAAFLAFIVRSSPGFGKSAFFIGILVVGIWLVWQLKIPEEKIHIMEFAILGWFASRDLIGADRRAKGIMFALGFTLAVGILDELFQAILPYRFFDRRDIAFNSAGSVWGIILYLLC